MKFSGFTNTVYNLFYELGIDSVDVFEVISDYRYKVEMNGIWENEICPIIVCFTDKKPITNKKEIENIRWIPWQEFLKEGRGSDKSSDLGAMC